MNPAPSRASEFPDAATPQTQTELALWATDEYRRLQAQGRAPDLEEWCARYPTCRSRVRRMVQAESNLAALLDRFEDAEGTSFDEMIDWPQAGSRFLDFTILRQLAWGSFARVYLATEATTGDRLVVLKCSLWGEAEARTMGRLAHPHIVPILSARRDDESRLTILCMPYLGSVTLENVLDLFVVESEKARPRQASFLHDALAFYALPEDAPPRLEPWPGERSYTDAIVRLAVQLAETLAFLHQRGVCHRDLKPSNVLLDPSGKPLLLDFNLSESERESDVPVGATLEYAAPEQLRAFLDSRKDGLDERTDLYAFAVVLYELLGGVHPCAGALAHQSGRPLAQALLDGLPNGFRPFREVCPDLERPAAALLDRCLAFDPADRPTSAADVAAALRRQFVPARRLRRWFSLHRRAAASITALFLVAAVLLSYAWSLVPPYSEREYERGRTAYHAGDFDAAETHFDHSVRAAPRNRRYRFARGCARLQKSKHVASDKANFDAVLEDLTPDEQGTADPQTLAVNAYVQARKQQYQTAIDLYDRIQPTGYRPIMVLNNRAYSYMGKRQWKSAQTDLDRAVQMDPHCQAARYNRAHLVLYQRMAGNMKTIPSQALRDVELALKLGTKTSDIYRDAALLYDRASAEDLREQRRDRALTYLRQAIIAGEPTVKFKPSPFLVEALKRPEFVALLENRSNQPSPQPDVRLLDPFEFEEARFVQD
jgi:serine/threonine protein kinase/Flp pilus assembly protein TadD